MKCQHSTTITYSLQSLSFHIIHAYSDIYTKVEFKFVDLRISSFQDMYAIWHTHTRTCVTLQCNLHYYIHEEFMLHSMCIIYMFSLCCHSYQY